MTARHTKASSPPELETILSDDAFPSLATPPTASETTVDLDLTSIFKKPLDERPKVDQSTGRNLKPIPPKQTSSSVGFGVKRGVRWVSAQEELVDDLPDPLEPNRLNVDELRRKLFGEDDDEPAESDNFLDDSDEPKDSSDSSDVDSDEGGAGSNDETERDQESADETAEDDSSSDEDEDSDDDPSAEEEEEEDQPSSRLLDRDCIDINPLLLAEVLDSVSQSYPLLEVAMAELAAAEGKTLASWGSFDSVLSAYSLNKPIGFYETFRQGAKYSRPLWNGGEVYSGYKIGRGQFEPWYQERQTNEGGQFSTGIKQPLMKGYAIDGRRVAVQTAQLERSRLEPDIQSRIIGMQLAAAQLYWKWVASGQVVRTQEQLVELARQRNDNLIKQVQAGDLPKITEIDNGRFIAKRQVKLNESQRKVREAAIKLSLFHRDSSGQPLLVADDRLPCDFPTPEPVSPELVESDINLALSTRPELVDLDFQQRQVELELCFAQNKTLPKLDAYAEASQDVGEESTSSRNKSPFEFEVGFLAEVPIQRREALGKIQAARGKLAQIAGKRRFVVDKIRSQVQDAVSALENAYLRIEQARENLRLTEQSLRLGRLRFREGDIDIIALNIYETSLAEAELLLIDAEFAYFTAAANYSAALAIR